MAELSHADRDKAKDAQRRAAADAASGELEQIAVPGAQRLPAGGTLAPQAVLGLQGVVGNRTVNRIVASRIQREGDEDQSPAAPTPGPIAAPASKAKGRWGGLKNLVAESAKFNEGTQHTSSDSDKQKTTTAGGAWLASQVGSKEKIGSADAYMGSRDDASSAHSKHLEQFASGAHAFITPAIHRNIHNLPGAWANFGGWGSDANFVAPLTSADALVKEAAGEKGKGIWELEEKLGIPKGQWVKACAPDYNIFRYIIHDTKKFNLRIPNGNERGAYASEWWNGKYQRGQWQPKGYTEGGAVEAVIDKISIDDMKLLEKEVFEMVNETSLAENTRKYLPDGPAAG